MGAGRWARHGRGRRTPTGRRHTGPHARPAVAPVIAAGLGAALLTTFTGPVVDDPGRAPDRAAAATVAAAAGAPVVDGPAPTGPDVADDRAAAGDARAPSPSLAGAGDTPRARGVPAIPTLPDVDAPPDELELAPFEAAAPAAIAPGETVPADLLIRTADAATLDRTDLDEVDGVRHHAAGARVAAVGPGDEPVEVLGVDGPTFRPLTPVVTAAEDAVWDRLAEGDVLVTHDLAERLDLELGGDLRLTGPRSAATVRVGAFAANGAPPVADVLAPRSVAEALGSAGTDLLVVSVTGDLGATGDALRTATGGEVELLRPPAPDLTETDLRTRQTEGAPPSGDIEPFSYTSRPDGRITIHGDWEARNIVPVTLPGMGTTRCHRTMAPQLLAAVEELIVLGLYDHLDPAQFAGCHVARHIDWRPDRPLSMHAWGLAIDVNTRDNPLGARPVMDPEVVAVFERWGFDWGGRWSRPDGMHFELARVVPVG